MPSTLAILTSDPNLLRCQFEQIKGGLRPFAQTPKAIGLGYIEADSILLRKKPGNVGTLDLSEMLTDVASEALFFYAGSPSTSAFADEDVMPLRFRRWMFMHHGNLGMPEATRAALAQAMPSFLARQTKGNTASEWCFLTFIGLMRDGGLSEEFELSPQRAGKALAEMTRRVQTAEREAGKVGSLGFYVTDGRVLAATRLGSGPLYYRLSEGIMRCPQCGINESTSDSSPALRAHRRVRAVVLASDVANPANFIEVPEASLITVGHGLDVKVTPLSRS